MGDELLVYREHTVGCIKLHRCCAVCQSVSEQERDQGCRADAEFGAVTPVTAPFFPSIVGSLSLSQKK